MPKNFAKVVVIRLFLYPVREYLVDFQHRVLVPQLRVSLFTMRSRITSSYIEDLKGLCVTDHFILSKYSKNLLILGSIY